MDQRAELLDRRDEELRERTRKILQTEGDVESQQRLLQDARQQLELARAEIQLAMRKYTEPAQDVVSPLPGPQLGSSVAAEVISDRPLTRPTDPKVEPDDCESEAPSNFPATDLRSELAGLFGLRKPTTDTVTPPPLPSAAYVDESQPSGENQSVIFHFDSDAAQLAATESMRAVSGEELPPREENSDGYVRDYMEQLLSRNRKSAGIALPSELKAAKNKKDPAASLAAKTAGEPSPKSPPKVKSYIELYMAGNMGDLENSETLTISEPVVEVKGALYLYIQELFGPGPWIDAGCFDAQYLEFAASSAGKPLYRAIRRLMECRSQRYVAADQFFYRSFGRGQIQRPGEACDPGDVVSWRAWIQLFKRP